MDEYTKYANVMLFYFWIKFQCTIFFRFIKKLFYKSVFTKQSEINLKQVIKDI